MLKLFRGVAQLVARDIWDVEAAGSNPVTPTTGKSGKNIRLWSITRGDFCARKSGRGMLTRYFTYR